MCGCIFTQLATDKHWVRMLCLCVSEIENPKHNMRHIVWQRPIGEVPQPQTRQMCRNTPTTITTQHTYNTNTTFKLNGWPKANVGKIPQAETQHPNPVFAKCPLGKYPNHKANGKKYPNHKHNTTYVHSLGFTGFCFWLLVFRFY